MQKAVVVHAGRRDSYQLALAMEEAGLLERLVTDVYFPGNSKVVKAAAAKLNIEDLLKLRYIDGLPFKKVSLSLKGMLLSARMKLTGTNNLHSLKDRFLGIQAREIAEATGSAVISYSTYAKEALKTDIRQRFLFQLHPHPISVQKILSEELELTPLASGSLRHEYELSLGKSEMDELCEEPKLARGYMVASTFTAKTLADNGVDLGKVHVVPYGINSTLFTAKSTYSSSDKLKVIFVGSFTQRKGLSYLLEAINQLDSNKVQLTLVGRGFIDKEILSKYAHLNYDVKVNVSNAELVECLHQADVFVLPSIAEGFAQVILEAMATGVPVITTPNTAGPDLLTEEENGFIVPIRNHEAIAEKLEKMIRDKSMREYMGRSARKRAELFTWEKFRFGVVDAYKKMLTDVSVDL